MTRIRTCKEDGAAAVEFAVVLPALLLIVFGIIEFGFIFNTQISLTQAAREGVRVEALGTGDASQTTQDAFLGAGGGTLNVTVQSCPTPSNPSARARVRAQLPYEPMLLPVGTIGLAGEAVMRCGG
jgi:Flp pilus assembly protein TadG